MSLQSLFPDPILHTHHFADLHPGQASDVWLVETSAERVVARTTRLSKTPQDEFWWGCRRLFGIDVTDVHANAHINRVLQAHSTIPVPNVIRTAIADGVQWLVVEVMPGRTVTSFNRLPLTAAHQLGRCVASIHQCVREECGNFRGTVEYPVEDFPSVLSSTLPDLVAQFHSHDQALAAGLSSCLEQIGQALRPTIAVPILLDMDPTQFLSDGTSFTALVDTEVYAFGPPEMELVALEYLLDAEHADAFLAGYISVRAFPHLTAVRPIYRYVNRVLSVQGAVPFSQWMNAPILFKESEP